MRYHRQKRLFICHFQESKSTNIFMKSIQWRNTFFKPFCHFPLVQSLVHGTFLTELWFLQKHMDRNMNEYDDYTQNLEEKSKMITDKKDQYDSLIKFARIHENIKQQILNINSKLLEFKIYESFLEGGPQSILQISILMHIGFYGWLQVFTVGSSMFTFTLASMNMYLHYPTKVFGLIYTAPFFFECNLQSFWVLGFPNQNINNLGNDNNFHSNCDQCVSKNFGDCIIILFLQRTLWIWFWMACTFNTFIYFGLCCLA